MKITRLFDVLYYQQKYYPLEKSLSGRSNTAWIGHSTDDVVKHVEALGLGLVAAGIQRQDKVAIAAYNCPEWVIADYAILLAGAVNVPLYPNSNTNDYRYILEHAECKMVFCGDEEIAGKMTEAVSEMPFPPKIYSFGKTSVADWKELFVIERSNIDKLNKIAESIEEDDLATIIYTSGTTGFPKGVMLSHRNILANCNSIIKALPLPIYKNRVISFLPLSHIFERTSTYYQMQCGISIYLTPAADNLGDLIREVKPHYFNTVPRVLEKVYEKLIIAGNSLSGLKMKLFFWALGLAKEYEPFGKSSYWYRLQLKIADRLIYSKWREAIGGNIIRIVSGAAALRPDLVQIFWAAKIPILEAYGLTESSPGVAGSQPYEGKIEPGSVGPPFPGVEVKFADDGELMARGDNIMLGYYKQPDETAKVLQDGWLLTGDIGEFTALGLVKITDRKKEIFKTSGGKYIAPQKIENLVKVSEFIEQILIIGEGRKFPAALIVPQIDQFKNYCKKNSLELSDQLIEDTIESEIHTVNAKLSNYEGIKKFKIIMEPFSVENGFLTPTMKIKRKPIMAHYSALVDSIYQEE